MSERDSMSFEDWQDIPRPVEFMAFQLVLGLLRSALVRDIVWQRQAARRLERENRYYFTRLVFVTWRRLLVERPGLPTPRYTLLTAEALGQTPDVVGAALLDAEQMALGEVV